MITGGAGLLRALIPGATGASYVIESPAVPEPEKTAMIPAGRPLFLSVAALILGGSALAADPTGPTSAESAQNSVQQDWAGHTATAALGEDGRVVMTYGEAPAALVCAPLHICAIEFGPEEEFHDTPSLSDPVRWQMEVREGYAGGSDGST